MGLEIIQMIKKERGITTETLSKLSGVPVGTLNKILNGETKDPKLETLKAIARVLGCTLDDFDDVHSRRKPIELTVSETKLFRIFRELNAQNQDKIIRYADVLLEAQGIDEIIEKVEEKDETDLNA